MSTTNVLRALQGVAADLGQPRQIEPIRRLWKLPRRWQRKGVQQSQPLKRFVDEWLVSRPLQQRRLDQINPLQRRPVDTRHGTLAKAAARISLASGKAKTTASNP